MQIDLREKADDKKNLAIGLGNLAADQQRLGRLGAAEANLRRDIELCREIEDESREAIGHQMLGRLLAYKGNFAEAERELGAALKTFHSQNQSQSEGISCAYRALLGHLRGDPKAALRFAREARQLADDAHGERDIIWAEWLLGWAHTALGETALKALVIADRCEFRLNQAEIHNFLARHALDSGKPADARNHAQKAKDYAYCDGPPHYYKPAYEEAERLLAEVAAAQAHSA